MLEYCLFTKQPIIDYTLSAITVSRQSTQCKTSRMPYSSYPVRTADIDTAKPSHYLLK